jgi:hypothetical protein
VPGERVSPGFQPQPGSGARVAPQQSPILLSGSVDFIALQDGARDRADFFPGVEEADFLIGFFDADEFSDEGMAGHEAITAPGDVAGLGDPSQEGIGGIFDGWKRLGPRAAAGAESRGGWIIREGFVRAACVVDLESPVVEIATEVFELIASGLWPEFAFEGAVEAFDLALSLGVVGSAMEGLHAESDEPRLEPGECFGDRIGSAERVVTEEGVREAELTEGVPEDLEGGPHAEIKAGDKRQEEARVIVQDGEGIGFLASDFERSFVIALPELIGSLALEALQVGCVGVRRGSAGGVSSEDVGDGADAGHGEVFFASEQGADFSRAPAELGADFEDAFLDCGVGACRREMGLA